MKAVKILIAAWIILLLLPGARSPEKNYRLAVKFCEKGELSKALGHVNSALRKNRTTEAMWLKGRILAYLGNHENAIYFLKYGMKAQPMDDNLIAIGDCHYELGNYEEALHYYRKVKHPGVTEYNNLAASFYHLNTDDSALVYLNMAIGIDSENPDTYFGRAVVYQDLLKMDCACRDYQKACDLGLESACDALEKENCLSWKSVWAIIE